MALKYTTVEGLWKFLGINDSILDFQPGVAPSREFVTGTGPAETDDIYLDQMGVNEDTLVLTRSSDNAALTITTHYTFDSDTSKVTLTAAGETYLSGTRLQADYDYNQLGKYLSYNETDLLLDRAEKTVDNETNVIFADQSASSPSYEEHVERDFGQGYNNNLYFLSKAPIVKLQTTTNGAFTTGSGTLTVDDASGFPSTATIYIGGNKVTYSSRSGNDLTIPTSTPSIDDGSTVRGEVVEVSIDAAGTSPSYIVLTPDTDYAIDYNTGMIQLLDDILHVTAADFNIPPDGVMDRMQTTYLHAYHDLDQDCTIPDDIVNAVYMIAGRMMLQRTVLKSHIGQRDNFDPQQLGFTKADIEEVLRRYRMSGSANI